jgi:hypothetical protein
MVRREIECVLKLCKEVPPDQLPQFIGELAEVSAVCFARLATPDVEVKPDESLNVKTAAKRMGISPSYLYKNHARYKFARKEGGRVVFSVNGLENYLQSKSR